MFAFHVFHHNVCYEVSILLGRNELPQSIHFSHRCHMD